MDTQEEGLEARNVTPDHESAEPNTQQQIATSPKYQKKKIKEKWIINPHYPSTTDPNPDQDTSQTAQGLPRDPACQAPGGGHREDPQVDQDEE